ncbi:MAG: hypothetical protein FWE07_08520 [Turicibacter sp.]|nr:hypothetical protein [Turicibacter sp.]
MDRGKRIISVISSFLLVLSLIITGSIQGLTTAWALEFDESSAPIMEAIEIYIDELLYEVNALNPDYEITDVEVTLDGRGEIHSVSYLIDLSAEAELDFQRQFNEAINEIQIEMGENPRMRAGSGLEFRSVRENDRTEWTRYVRAGNQTPCGMNHGSTAGARLTGVVAVVGAFLLA